MTQKTANRMNKYFNKLNISTNDKSQWENASRANRIQKCKENE